MAQIPVEKEHNGSNWWVWLLALLVIGGVIWAVAALTGEEEPAPITEVPEPVEPPAGAVIMDLSTITTASNVADFYGRELQVNNLYVTEVVSDKAFFACSAETATPGQPVQAQGGQNPCTTEEVLVALDENAGAGPTPPPGNQVEGAVNVNEGQMVTITNGRVGEFMRSQASAWGLTEEDITQAAQQEFYIEANSINITRENVASAM